MIQQQIREILLRDCDPIGVGKEANAQDEYDGFVAGVYRVLASGAPPRSVAEYLARVEGDKMGLGVAPDRLLGVAKKLCALDVKLGITDGAV